MPFPNVLLLQFPAWLWLLGALAIPFLIHLVRRSAPREITFAALQWLRQKRQCQWQRLFLRDRWLLLLRMVLLALLALLLAAPLYQRLAQPSDRMLLVDPAVSAKSLQQFLAVHPQITDVYWLQAEPTEISAPRPPAVDIGQTLSQLASAGEFRRAQILLHQRWNPSSYHTLTFSPYWQWHSVDPVQQALAPSQLAVVGNGPQWLEPALQQLEISALQHLSTHSEIDPHAIDWLIYDTPGELPPPLWAFARAGGMLITDAWVQSGSDLDFIEIEPGLEAAAIGRGSWLRYRDNWHEDAFYRHADLPQQLWQQWTAQDWQWQHRSRGQWSDAGVAGIALPDEAVTGHYRVSLQSPLLMLFALLLLVERTVALSRRSEQGNVDFQINGGSDE